VPVPDDRQTRNGPETSVSAADFARSFGEDLTRTLDLGTWHVGSDLAREFERIEAEVREAVVREESLHGAIRRHLLPKLRTRTKAPRSAGHYADVSRNELEAIHKGLLFNGGVEACDGALHVHDTLALTIYQIGITLVSYRGNHGTWSQRLFRRDLRQSCDDPIEEVLAILEKRNSRGSARTEEMGEMVQKTLLAYAERAILFEKSRAVWRIGHGNPVPYELLTGGGNVELMEAGINVLRKLIEGHQKFLFVAKEPTQRHLLTIGQALLPWEFAVVATLEETLDRWLHQLRFTQEAGRTLLWDGRPLPAPEWIPRFIREVASKVVVGVFRATTLAPAQVFFAHMDHADVAGRLAIADGMFQEHRGVPLLLDLARQVGDTVFGDSLNSLAESTFGAVGAPWRHRPHGSAE
jgi:hypothetical protein